MAMLTTGFDVSYDEPKKRFLVMCGFLSDAEAWSDFDKAWRERLRMDGLQYFHMQRLRSLPKCSKDGETRNADDNHYWGIYSI